MPVDPDEAVKLDADSGEPRSVLLTRLFEEHNQELIGFLCTRLRSEQDAKEVAQEAYARLLSLDQPGAVSLLRAYLFRTASNLAIDRMRHRSTREAVHQMFQSSAQGSAEPSAELQAANSQQASLVVTYLKELPKRCREAFLLYRVYEMSLQDVARQMRVTDRMVRYYVSQAMSHVRARLDGEKPGE